MKLVHRAVRMLGRAALGFYYQEVEVRGAEQVPRTGPLLVLANHQISLVDPLLLLHAIPRPIRFLAKAPLFRIPVQGFLMRRLGAIPVHRRQDQGYAKEKNTGAYDLVAAAFERGEAIGIFPEGISHDEPALGEFRHGAARMALEAEARHGFDLGLSVVLAGIHIEDSRLFRGRVLVTLGPGLSLRDLAPNYRQDPREATAALTARLRDELARWVVEAEDREDVRLAGLVDSLGLMPPTGPGLSGALERKRFVLGEYRRLKETHPRAIHWIRQLLLLYQQALDLVGERPSGSGSGGGAGPGLFEAGRLLAWSPVVVLGLVVNAVPFWSARVGAFLLTRLQGRGQDVRASLGILLGSMAFMAWYATLTWIGVTRCDPRVALPVILVAPACGLAAVSRITELKTLLRRTWVRGLALGSRTRDHAPERLRRQLRDEIRRLYALEGVTLAREEAGAEAGAETGVGTAVEDSRSGK